MAPKTTKLPCADRLSPQEAKLAASFKRTMQKLAVIERTSKKGSDAHKAAAKGIATLVGTTKTFRAFLKAMSCADARA